MKALAVKDKKWGIKVFARVHVVPLDFPIGTMDLIIFAEQWGARFDAMGGWPESLTWDAEMCFSWPKIGHMALMPPIPEGTPPHEHVYDRVVFRGVEFPLSVQDTKIRGTYIVDSNFDHMSCVIVDPLQPWNRLPITHIVAKTRMLELVTAFALDTVRRDGSVAIANGPTQFMLANSPSAKSRASSSCDISDAIGDMSASQSQLDSGADTREQPTSEPDSLPGNSASQSGGPLGGFPAAGKSVKVVLCPGIRTQPKAPTKKSQKKELAQAALCTLEAPTDDGVK
jgi:hypothetical protein